MAQTLETGSKCREGVIIGRRLGRRDLRRLAPWSALRATIAIGKGECR
jgi:hypothetical protein